MAHFGIRFKLPAVHTPSRPLPNHSRADRSISRGLPRPPAADEMGDLPFSRADVPIRGLHITGGAALSASAQADIGCVDLRCESRITRFLFSNAGPSAMPDRNAAPSSWAGALKKRVLVYEEDGRGIMQLHPFHAGGPPDNRTVMDLAGGAIDILQVS